MFSFPSPELIELAGVDAERFAQAQFCNDVSVLTPGASQLNAWLNPQGRVRRLFHLYRVDESRFLMLLRGGEAQPLLAPLRMFVLRLKVQVAQLSGWQLAGLDSTRDSAAPGPAEAFVIDLADGRRLLLSPPATAFPLHEDAEAMADWIRRDISAGLPWLPGHALEQLLPSWLEFARIGAINHQKGCYPGQEIVARLHFRGGGDKRMLAQVSASTEALADTGALRGVDGTEAGLLLQWAPGGNERARGLAVLRRELAVAGTCVYGERGLTIQTSDRAWAPGE